MNWGHSGGKTKEWADAHILNHPERVRCASNKLKFFEMAYLAGVNIPLTTSSKEVAEGWKIKGHTVMARTKLAGHSGDGLVVVGLDDEMVEAPLYTQLIPIQHEFRVHVVGNEAIDIRHKVRRKSVPECEANYLVRSHKGGWAYNKGIPFTPDPSIFEQAVKALAAVGLDFGAVDVVWGKDDKAYVLEVNTAPGITGSTVELYANALKALAEEKYNE